MADIITIEECITRLDAIRHEIVSDSRDHFALSAGIAALYELEKDTPAVNRWISVEDALPEDWKEVLVVLNSNGYQSIHIGEMQEDGGWMVSGEFWYDKGDSAITHWMPLPEIPKPPEKE